VAIRARDTGPRADRRPAAGRWSTCWRARATPVFATVGRCRWQRGLVNVEGVVPGHDRDEIVLSAHYDSVAGSPDRDDSSGCGVAVAAAADLRRTPLRHTCVWSSSTRGSWRTGQRGVVKAGGMRRASGSGDLNLEMLGWAGRAVRSSTSFRCGGAWASGGLG